jgi:PAS domain-containing protein
VERVYDGGKPVFGDEVPARIDRHNDGGLDEAFFTFVYHPTRDVAGRVDGVMIFGVEVTEQVRARRQVEELAGAAETRATELEATLEVLADGVILYDAEAGKRRDNRALRAILGLDADPAYDALPFAVRRDRLDIVTRPAGRCRPRRYHRRGRCGVKRSPARPRWTCGC